MDDLIVKTIVRMIIPFIQVYGLFIVLHGHLSVGGGFSGGAVLGASLILYTLAFGIKKSNQKVSHTFTQRIESGGILTFILIGSIGILLGGNFLSNQSVGFFMGNPGQIISAGMIPLITIAIGLKVASTMITLFLQVIEEEE